MEKSDIQRGLEQFVEELTSQTYLHTYRMQKRSSLLADGLGTRANSIWKMANYIIAYCDDSSDTPIGKYLDGWAALCKNYKNQFLFLELDKEGHWQMYNSHGNLMGENSFIVEYLHKQGLRKANRKNHIKNSTIYRPYITAIKSKPFLLLAGISGTGKSRIVRELARACWEEGSAEYTAQKPSNFEMIQVKPNWHDSSELFGYISRVSGQPEYVPGEFLKFVARAWENIDVPHFLCLDEMNLAPVEQYFAEFLSVIESRKCNEDGVITTDPILEKTDTGWYFNLTTSITTTDVIRHQFNEKGISLPPNLVVVGTVNMDETTFSFSRKVLDRAMSIEMNEVDLYGGLTERYESIGKIDYNDLIGTAVEGVDVYAANKDVCDLALEYLSAVNEKLEGTPFKIAYRTRNEFLLYVVNNLPYNQDEEGKELPQGYVIARALDEITSMKILSRIEGDDTKVKERLLTNLMDVIETKLAEISGEEHSVNSISLAKLKEMKEKLAYGYTSFWS